MPRGVYKRKKGSIADLTKLNDGKSGAKLVRRVQPVGIELDPYQEVIVEFHFESSRILPQQQVMSLNDAITAFNEHATGMSGVKSVRIFTKVAGNGKDH